MSWNTCHLSLLALLATSLTSAQTVEPSVDAQGAVTTASARLPFPAYASPQALQRFQGILTEGKAAPGLNGSIEASRKFYEQINADRVARMKQRYPVVIQAQEIGGIAVDVVTPAAGESNKQRVLINLHGGAFLWGAGSGGLVESIPVASRGKIKVISVDYRQGPEYSFPAASEDVEKVYRVLLKQYSAQHIGIYGCSAGGILTAEVVAWLGDKKLPTPGAIGIFCAGVTDMNGDSVYVAPMLMGETVPTQRAPDIGALPYLKHAAVDDPLVWPGVSAAVLARFPPTLLISGTRDFAMSAVLHSQDLLVRAGVTTELHVWDGMWHSFFSDPELPESRAAYEVMANFFNRQLGRTTQRPTSVGQP